ncbi:MAG TPA: diguanylate cyclase [Candidatus Dormibacteraeota bacterium]|nr:diguanylate cyclase [Candidatus Dormibacteraeota bacterium]
MTDKTRSPSDSSDTLNPAKDGNTRILIAEDDPVARRVVKAFLTKWGYNVLAVSDGADAWRILQSRDAPRLVLLDWMLPGLEGIEICRRVRQDSTHPYIYILLLTGSSQKQELLEALHAGADDYLVKPFDAAELRARIYVGRRILAAQDELIAAREALRFQATHDPLTGLWNHGELLRILDRELARANRAHQSLSLLMVDLDHFKEVNDRYGHLVGDEVLSEISRRLLASVRAYDVVGRCGGEEFIIVVPAIERDASTALAERIVAHIGERFFETSAGPVKVTVSLGASFSSSDNPLAPIDLIRAADIALYRAKQNGRNRAEASISGQIFPDYPPGEVESAPPVDLPRPERT